MEDKSKSSIKRRSFLSYVGEAVAGLVTGCSSDSNKKVNQTINPREISPGLERIAWMREDRAHRSAASVFPYENLVHLIGGSNDWQWTWPSKKYSTFNPDTLEWTEKEDMPKALAHITAFGIEGDIITVGGKKDDHNDYRSGPIVDQVLRYDTESDKWTTLRNFPSTLASAKAIIVNGVPHILGGYTSFNHKKGEWFGTTYEKNSDVFAYDTATDKWEVKTTIPTTPSFWSMSVSSHEGKIYVFGSKYGERKEDLENLAQIYDPKTDTWDKQTMPSRFDEMHAFTHGDNLHLWTCEESYDFDSGWPSYTGGHALFTSVQDGQWNKINLPEIRYGVVSNTEKIAHNGQLYLFGPFHPGVGYDGSVFKLDLQKELAG